METFASIALKRWRQFEHVELDLSQRLCVLTGPNGCGKTTVLSVLGRHFGWNLNFLSASFVTKEQKRIYSDGWDVFDDQERHVPIGTITYTGGSKATVEAPVSKATQYDVRIQGRQQVHGLHIPSHRPPPGYARLETIPINPKSAQQHYQAYQSYLFQSYGEQPQRNPSVAMKEALIAFAVFGEGNRSVQANAEYVEILKKFEEILRRLLPERIGFETIEIETPDVILRTKSGRFPLESMSGGLNALFGIAWQIHMHGAAATPSTVLIDEPENHLHPSMQREFLPRLLEAFPSNKFVVATHSPFIVSSAPDAAVYAMLFNEERRVTSTLLDETDLAASPNKVLREVLDVPVTMPLWVERRIESILAEFRGSSFDAATIARLRAKLRTEGLEDAFGDFIAQPTSQDNLE